MATFTKFDYKMFNKARQIAETSNFESFHLGCVITYKHKIIGAASNSTKTHPMQKRYNRRYRNFKKGRKPIVDSLHAEIAALSSISYPVAQQVQWKDVSIYVYRICNGKPLGHGTARPCAACRNALRDAGIVHLYYTGEDSFIYERLIQSKEKEKRCKS